ncbi:MAG: TFIIB-type zinc ribbon-containing protein [Anaerolineales bacterium]
MPESQYRARQVSAKTHEVVEYDHNDSLPGKPLHILIPGGLVALASLGVIILVAYLTWFKGELAPNTGVLLVALLAPFYVGGVFLFSYGYELYNIPRALRLTAIIVFLTVGAVVIVAVLFFVLGSGKGLPESSSKKKSSGGSKVLARSAPPSSSNSGLPNLGPVVFLGGPGRTHTREVTREVVKEVEVPVAPRAVDCPFCGRSYVPADENYACPACGAVTPKELIEASQAPKDRSV